MPRRPTLEPKSTKKPDYPWLIDLPPALSSTGKRDRRYFETKKEAAEFGRQQRIRFENFGTASTLLPPGKIEEAAAAFDLLAPFRVSLGEVVADWIGRRAAANASVTFGELLNAFRNAKTRRSKKYTRDLAQLDNRFPQIRAALVCEITSEQIEAVAEAMTPAFRNLNLRMLRAIFNYGVKKKWLLENPISRLDFATLPETEVHVLSPEEARRLMMAAVDLDKELVAYHAITLFAGIRPEETERLDWGAFDLEEGHIKLTAEVSKKWRKRFVPIEPTLRAWVLWHFARGGARTGPVTPSVNLIKRNRAIRELAGFSEWVQDSARHTFASCWLKTHGDINRLCLILGHRGTDMLWNHYHKAVSPKHAQAFWAIEPPSLPANVIPIEAAA